MAVSSALGAGRPLPTGRSLVLISVRGLLDPRATGRLQGLSQLKNQLCYHVPPYHVVDEIITKLRGLSLQANYTDRAIAACRRS
jgi:hypothetical protein